MVSMASVCSLTAMGAGYKSVVINQPGGGFMAVTIEDGMSTKISDGNLVLTSSKGDIILPVSDVQNWTFSTEGGSNDLWAGVELPSGDEVSYVQQADRIVFANLPVNSEVSLVSMDGRVVNRSKVSGSYELPLTGLQKGVYVLTFNDKSVKIAVAR